MRGRYSYDGLAEPMIFVCCRCQPPSMGALFMRRARRANESRTSGVSLRAHGRDHLSMSATKPGPRLGAIFVLDRTICRCLLPDLGQGQVQYLSRQVLQSASTPEPVSGRVI